MNKCNSIYEGLCALAMNKDGGKSCSAWTAGTAFLETANGHADNSNCRGIRDLPESW